MINILILLNLIFVVSLKVVRFVINHIVFIMKNSVALK